MGQIGRGMHGYSNYSGFRYSSSLSNMYSPNNPNYPREVIKQVTGPSSSAGFLYNIFPMSWNETMENHCRMIEHDSNVAFVESLPKVLLPQEILLTRKG
uniref:Uncharacterized protein n=1 Tax=Arundo donax TaxID=35708 RepID=A0A0A9H3F5_ARUDO